MHSHIYLTGRLVEAIDETTRYVEVDEFNHASNLQKTFRHPVTHFSKDKKNKFMKINNDTLVIIKGRLENHPVTGYVIVAEIIEYLGNLHLNQL